jgi:formylmethanofuran dehydrogenase subunit E
MIVDFCDKCGRDIYAGEDVVDIDGHVYCTDCIELFYRKAEDKPNYGA